MTNYTNFARSVLTSDILTTSVSIGVDDGANFPTEDFYIVIDGGNADREIIFVTSRSGNILTTSLGNRGLKGTSISEHSTGAIITHSPLAHDFEDALNATNVFIPGRPQGILERAYEFTSGLEGWTTDQGTLVQDTDAAKITTSGATVSLVTSPETFTDGEIIAEVSSDSGSYIIPGLAFHIQGNGDHYLFYATSGRWHLWRSGPGHIFDMGYTPLPGSYGTKFRLMVRTVGDKMSFYVNDIHMGDFIDSTYTSGTWGVYAYNGVSRVHSAQQYSLASNWEPTWSGGKLATAKPTGVTHYRQGPHGSDTGDLIAPNNTYTLETQEITLDEPKIVYVSGVAALHYENTSAAGIAWVEWSGNRRGESRWHTYAANGGNEVMNPSGFFFMPAGTHDIELKIDSDSGSAGSMYCTRYMLEVAVLDPYDVGTGGSLSGAVSSVQKSRTAGDITVGAAYAAVDTNTDLTLDASIGNVIEVGLSATANDENATDIRLDAATIIGGSSVNWVSSGTSTQATEGVQAWYIKQNQLISAGGSVLYTVTADDIQNGKVTLRFYAKRGGTARTISASDNQPFVVHAKNLSRITIDGIESNLADAETVSVRAKAPADQSVPNTTWTVADFTGGEIDHDTHSMFDQVNTFTVPSTGIYRILVSGGYDVNGTGSRYFAISKNGSRLYNYQWAGSSGANDHNTVHDTLTLVEGDEIQVELYQDSGGSLNTQYVVLSINKIESVLPVYENSYSILPSWKGFDIDAPKAWADYVDDEFDSPTLNPKWTVVGGNTGTTSLLGSTGGIIDLASKPGSLLIQNTGVSGSHVRLRQDYALPDGKSLILPVNHTGLADSASAWANNEVSVRLMVNDNDSSWGGGNYVGLTLDHSADNLRIIGHSSTGAALELPDSGGYTQLGRVYLRIARSGLDYYLFVSFDGNSWIPFGSVTMSGEMTNIWIASDCDASFGNPKPIVEVPWIRQGSNENVPWISKPDAGVTIKGASIRDRLWLPDQDDPLGLDDEFDDDLIDPAWIIIDSGINQLSINEAAGKISMKAIGNGGNTYRWIGICKPIIGISYPFYIDTAVSILGGSSGCLPMGGLLLTDTASYGSGKQHIMGTWPGGGNAQYFLRDFTSSTTYVSGSSTPLPTNIGHIYLRMVYISADTFQGYISPDGIHWTNTGAADFTKPLTPTHFGIVINGYGVGSASHIISSFEYFRVRKGLPS